MNDNFDIAVVGAGIAGASIAAEIADLSGKAVALIEAEDRPGYHTSGRSAAFWEECYGGPDIVPLTLPSGRWLRERGFLSPRGALYIGREQDKPAMDAFVRRFADSGVTIERLDRAGIERMLPGLRESWTCALWEAGCADIDVAGLHQHYLASASRAGVRLLTRARVSRADREGGSWSIETEQGEKLRAGILVNAAGAWADTLAATAGARPIGIQPLRRTVAQIRTEPTPQIDLPLVLDISGGFYFKPESGRLWLSPHDEEPSLPCDAAPEELAVAEAIDRFERVVDWRVAAVERKWAGLRSFAPDRAPVFGFDPQVPGLFWFAGQGGFGFQTAPAAARLGAQLLLGLDRDDLTQGIDAAIYDPGRFSP